MGSPVSPVLADIYMENFETEALKSKHAPRFWRRYVDDTFAIIHSRYLSRFLQHLNSIKPGVICFTHELETNNRLPFLEVLVTRMDNGDLITSIYRKPTHTDQLLNFHSHHPASVKRSVVSTLTRRNQIIPSTSLGIVQEKQHLKKVFRSNNYPQQFVQQAIHCTGTSASTMHETPIASVSIPYIKGTSEHIKRLLQKVNIRTCFKSHNTLRHHLCHPKDAVPKNERSGVVYCIPCKDCNFSYVGETGLHLSTRVKQHREATRKCETDRSAIAEHVWSKHHQMDWDNVSILDFEPHTKLRKVREAVHIKKRSSLLNRDQGLDISNIWDPLFNS